MLIVVMHLIAIGSNVSLAGAGELFVPVTLAAALLVELRLLGLLEFFGRALLVFLELRAGRAGEETWGQSRRRRARGDD